MIVLQILGALLLFIFFLGLLGALGVVGMAYHMKKQLRRTMADMEKTQEPTAKEGDVELVQCPHCGTFILMEHQSCEACGKRIR